MKFSTHTYNRLPIKHLAYGIFVCSLLGVIAISWLPSQNPEIAKAEKERNQRVNLATKQLQQVTETYIQVLHGARAFATADETMDRPEWQMFYESNAIAKRLPGVGAIGYLERVPARNKASFEAEVIRDTTTNPDGYRDFKIHPDGDRDEYLVVKYIEPFNLTSMKQTFGFDYLSDPARSTAAKKAIADNTPIISEPVISKTTKLASLIMMLPVYENYEAATTPVERQNTYKGLAVISIRSNDFFDQAFSDLLDQDLEVEVFDGQTADDERRMYDSKKNDKVLGVNSNQNNQIIYRKINVADRTWTLKFTIVNSTTTFQSIFPTSASKTAILIITNITTAMIIIHIHRLRKK